MNSIFGGQNQNGMMNQFPGGNGPSPFASFVSNFMQKFPRMNPQDIGMQLLSSGRMSQADFQAFSQVANRLTGRSK